MKIAVIIPTLNEHMTIANVINGLKTSLRTVQEKHDVDIIVCDGRSSDGTQAIASRNGARILTQQSEGKGNAIRECLESVSADIYVFVDGDETYDVFAIQRLINPILYGKADMVVASRVSQEKSTLRDYLHSFGNKALQSLFNTIFHQNMKDYLSGFRAINLKVANNLKLTSSGFEVEIEMTILAVKMNACIVEVPLLYAHRPMGSNSKLKSFRDGFRLIRYLLINPYRGDYNGHNNIYKSRNVET